MSNENKAPQNDPNVAADDDEAWDSVGDEADETCRLAPLESDDPDNPAADGLERRYRVVGEYRGTKIVKGKFGLSDLHILRVTEDGQDYMLGVWGFPYMSKKMAQIPIGTRVRMTYAGEKDVGKGNPMKMATVDIPKGAKRNRLPESDNSDNVPF